MLTPIRTKIQPHELEEALDALDRLIHRSKTLLHDSPTKQLKITGTEKAWRAVKGLWQHRDAGDALQYQQNIREELERHSGV